MKRQLAFTQLSVFLTFMGFLCFFINPLQAQETVYSDEQPSYTQAHRIFKQAAKEGWELVGEPSDIKYLDISLTGNHSKEILVLMPVKVNYSEELYTLACMFYRSFEQIKTEEGLRYIKLWKPLQWWELTQNIELFDFDSDKVKEIILQKTERYGDKIYHYYEIISLRSNIKERLYHSKGWEPIDKSYSTVMVGDTLFSDKKISLIPYENTLQIQEAHHFELVKERNSPIVKESKKGMRNFVFNANTKRFDLVSDNKPLGLVGSDTMNYFEEYLTDLYRCFKISHYKSSSGNEHINNLLDRDLNTCWSEESNGFGNGEFIEFTFWTLPRVEPKEDIPFVGFFIINGDHKLLKEDKWRETGRVKTLQLYYNNEPFLMVDLLDSPNGQIIDISQHISFQKGMQFFDGIKAEIIEVYPGNDSQKTSITEFLPFCIL